MNIEDKLPKAEDVLREHHVSDSLFSILNRDGFTPASQGDRIIKAMHEYARRLLDVVADNATTKLCQELQIRIVDRDSILKLKEILK